MSTIRLSIRGENGKPRNLVDSDLRAIAHKALMLVHNEFLRAVHATEMYAPVGTWDAEVSALEAKLRKKFNQRKKEMKSITVTFV